ncbi:MAG TPA: hypothetical protein PL195_02370, partial [bacterium]|nr:hypothetical protein [bacterium]
MNSRLIELLKNLYKENILDDINNAEKVLKNISDNMPKIADNLLLALRLGKLNEIINWRRKEFIFPHIIMKIYSVSDELGEKRAEDAIEAIIILAFVCDTISEEQMYEMFENFDIISETYVPKILLNNLKEV